RSVASDHWRAFGQAVPLIDRYSRAVKESREVWRERSAARNQSADAPAQSRPQFRKDQRVGHFVLEIQNRSRPPALARPPRPLPGHTSSPPSYRGVPRATLFGLLHRARIDFLEEPRDAGHEIRTGFDHVLRHGLKAPGVIERNAGVKIHIDRRPFENVRKG